MRLLLLSINFFITTTIFSQGKFFGGNGDGFATATITNIVLPIQVLQFSVTKEANYNKAKLLLASTDAICNLQLEKSNDGNSFVTVDSLINNAGFRETYFEFTDNTSAGSITYYRVKIIRCDGSFLYSKTALLRNDIKENQFYVSGSSLVYTISSPGSLQVVNTMGQVVLKKSLMKGSGILSLGQLAGGVYYLRLDANAVKSIFIKL